MDVWTVDRTGATQIKGWDPKGADKAAQANWNEFMSAVKAGTHPNQAGKDFKYLNKATGQAQIKLSQSQRATFFVDEANKRLYNVQLGGHT